MANQKCIFRDFSDYWHCAKNLSREQRDSIFNSLPNEHQEKLRKSYFDGGWEDLFMRDILDKILDRINNDFNTNLLSLRIKILKGKNQEIDKKKWAVIVDMFDDFDDKYTNYIFGGITAEVVNESCVLLKKDESLV
jgi:hypothetical protein